MNTPQKCIDCSYNVSALHVHEGLHLYIFWDMLRKVLMTHEYYSFMSTHNISNVWLSSEFVL